VVVDEKCEDGVRVRERKLVDEREISLKKLNMNLTDDGLLTLRSFFEDKVTLYFVFLNYYRSSLFVMVSGGSFAVLLASVFPALRPVLMRCVSRTQEVHPLCGVDERGAPVFVHQS